MYLIITHEYLLQLIIVLIYAIATVNHYFSNIVTNEPLLPRLQHFTCSHTVTTYQSLLARYVSLTNYIIHPSISMWNKDKRKWKALKYGTKDTSFVKISKKFNYWKRSFTSVSEVDRAPSISIAVYENMKPLDFFPLVAEKVFIIIISTVNRCGNDNFNQPNLNWNGHFLRTVWSANIVAFRMFICTPVRYVALRSITIKGNIKGNKHRCYSIIVNEISVCRR